MGRRARQARPRVDPTPLLPPHAACFSSGPLWPVRPRDALLLLLRHARRRGAAVRRRRAEQARVDLPQGVQGLGRARAGGCRARRQDRHLGARVVPGLRHRHLGDGAQGQLRAALRRAGEAAQPGEGAERDRRRKRGRKRGRRRGRRRGAAAFGRRGSAAAAAASAAAEALRGISPFFVYWLNTFFFFVSIQHRSRRSLFFKFVLGVWFFFFFFCKDSESV